jgi:hypothetical protein
MLDIRTWPAPLAPLDVPRALRVVTHVGDEPDHLVEVLTCPSTRQAFVVDRVICGDKAPAVRIVLAHPVDPVPQHESRFRRRPGRAVAIKIFARRPLLPSQGRPDASDLEIAATHLLSFPGHPNVAPLLGCVQDEKHTYLVTRFYEGADFSTSCRGGPGAGYRGSTSVRLGPTSCRSWTGSSTCTPRRSRTREDSCVDFRAWWRVV